MIRWIFPLLVLLCSSCTSEPLQDRLGPYGAASVPCENPSEGPDQGISAQMRAAGIEDSTGTWAYVLEEGEEAIFSRAWLGQKATRSIDIQYFIFSMDNVGIIALDQLLRAADRGVQVRMLVDDFLLDVEAEDVAALNAHPNITIRIYNPTEGKNTLDKARHALADFQGFNQRMHNKTFVVDGRVAITGGRNIADEYFDYDQDYNFRDRDVLLLGTGAQKVQTSFDAFWSHPLAVELEGDNKTTADPSGFYDKIHAYRLRPRKFLARDPGPHRWHSRGHTQVDCCRSVAPFGGDTFCL